MQNVDKQSTLFSVIKLLKFNLGNFHNKIE